MEKNTYSGKFIVFEGLDGSGQSTQASLLRDFLSEKGYKVLLTKEPTQKSSASAEIKQINDEKIAVPPKKFQELFTQDREEHLANEIIPALKSNTIVICDRYFFSTFAFGASEGLDLEWLIEINNDFLMPDLTFLLKVNPEVCVRRIEKRGEGIKFFEKKEKLEKVWKTYEILPSRFENVYMISGEEKIDEVFSRIKEVVLSQIINNSKGV